MNPQHLGHRKTHAGSVEKLGDAHLDLGDPQQAKRFYEQTVAIDRALIDEDPDNFDHSTGLSTSMERMGDVYMALNDPENAGKAYGESIANQRRAVELDSHDLNLKRELALAIGIACKRFYQPQGNFDAAREDWREVITLRQEIVDADPSDRLTARLLEAAKSHLQALEP